MSEENKNKKQNKTTTSAKDSKKPNKTSEKKGTKKNQKKKEDSKSTQKKSQNNNKKASQPKHAAKKSSKKSSKEDVSKTKNKATKQAEEKNKNEKNKSEVSDTKDKNIKSDKNADSNADEKIKDQNKDSNSSEKEKETKKAAVLEKQEERLNEKAEKERVKAKRKKIIAIVGGIVGGLATIYLAGVLFFSYFSYPSTIVADTNVGLKTPDAIKSILDDNSDNYKLEIYGLGYKLNIKGDDINYDFDSDTVFKNMQESKNPFIWPVAIFLDNSFKDNYVVQFDSSAVDNIVLPTIDVHNTTAIQPVNAGFNLDATATTATIKEETIGTTLDPNKTLTSVKEKIGSASQHLEVGENEQVLPTVYADDSRMETALSQANTMLKTVMNYTIDGVLVSTLTSLNFGPWIEVDPTYNSILNQPALIDWASQLAATCNTAGKTRTFVTPYGKQVSVTGSIGWTIDEEGLCSETNKYVTTGTAVGIAVPCSSSLESYGGPGGKDWGNRYIDVDISEQMVRMYDDSGSLIFSAACVSGKPDTPTPCGLFTVYGKQSPTILHASDGSYHTPVSYWMPFSGGCGFHDATWQSSFGGNRWRQGFGSHGCVNLSLGSAQSLYGICRVGDIVAVHY